jgi:hypothetical protein
MILSLLNLHQQEANLEETQYSTRLDQQTGRNRLRMIVLTTE